MGNVSNYKDGQWDGPNDIANEIILTRNAPGNELISFLLVEGHTDKSFYRRFTNTNT